jgi:TonB family protein
MSRRTSKRAQGSGWTGWTWAVAGSSLVHVVVLAGLWRGGARQPAPVEPEAMAIELKTAQAGWDEAAPGAEPLPNPTLPPLQTLDEALVARPRDAPEGERDNAVAKTVGPREGEGRERAAPAADQGEAGGRLPGLATRRDRSTLESRVADAETDAQSQRLRTSRRSSSPQAMRREARTGVGDSVRTSEATRASSAAAPEPPPAPSRAPPDVAGPATGAKVAARTVPLDLAMVSPRPTPERGEGPLDVEAGARMFDVEARGRLADDQTRRAVSNEAHPGITDFSHAGVVAAVDTRQGRGPGQGPGTVARASNGTAPAVYGARSPQELAADAVERTRDRLYDRYRQEIQRRVQNVLVFPKVLALRLEQGEAVVTFVVRPDGALGDGPRIVKSSGFVEFDAEAVKAVLRAAPFPRRIETAGISLSMPVTFENPLVR